MNQKVQSGFTLVELAIVLVVIGLIMGMAFKGRELIEGARVRNMAATLNKFQTATNVFFERYQAFPGDGCSAGATTLAQCTGARDGLATTSAERAAVTTLLNGLNLTQDADWKSPFGSRWGVVNPAFAVPGATHIGILSTPNTAAAPDDPAIGTIGLRFACALDQQIDDGLPNTGNVRVNTAAGTFTAATDCWSLSAAENVQIAVRLYP
ncbi:prepilin-type N-terminal cleavage/methylation domain-containing protein [Formivibrio citricus]|uniref:Prepilin-type N-terminal cleavage/methylation domain-containing protein n=1 Tax=Formivibrio citricus TaxID=83765 RepID=A0A1I4Z2K6_9NEIS|nr:prepilin-type N-terminal cleavage/methylation domain-containing protein [Formivibrio citricus]SFN44209.1 prepilin-type N-terminal cleavage/methylation domain-containing protein [Formivibrio citricus]